MTVSMDPVFTHALRALLVETARNPARPRRLRRRVWAGVALGLALAGGAGVAVAQLRAIPGGEVVETVAAPHTVDGVGPARIDLGPAPEAATAVSFALTCMSAGTFSYGPAGSSTCADADVSVSTTSGEVPLSALDGTSFVLGASPQARWTITVAYVRSERVPLGVNDRGETYGVEGAGGTPDLIAAIATNGRQGYVRRSDLDAAQGDPASPEEALAWQAQHAGDVVYIPVYSLDGETVIGRFRVGDGTADPVP